jgi:hypothetical protein
MHACVCLLNIVALIGIACSNKESVKPMCEQIKFESLLELRVSKKKRSYK